MLPYSNPMASERFRGFQLPPRCSRSGVRVACHRFGYGGASADSSISAGPRSDGWAEECDSRRCERTTGSKAAASRTHSRALRAFGTATPRRGAHSRLHSRGCAGESGQFFVSLFVVAV
jgi:hypothetical protein